jgi:prepilin-type N-terminal cleavage/methylation domain-containing protein
MIFFGRKNALNRNGVTLIELLVAILIASIFILTLVAIFMESHRGLLNTYKNNILKNRITYAMTHIQRNLHHASRIDSLETGFGNCNMASASDAFFTTRYLAGAINVDRDEGCYPVDGATLASWFYYCFTGPDDEGQRELYYYHRQLAGQVPCPITVAGSGFGQANYPSITCGENVANVTRERLLGAITDGFFTISRCQFDRVNVTLEIRYRGGERSKPIQYGAQSDFKVGMSAQNCALGAGVVCY